MNKLPTPNLAEREARVYDPLVPFWARAAAFGIDVAIVGVGCWLLWSTAPDVALTLSPVALYWQIALWGAMLIVMGSSLGGGRTPGLVAIDAAIVDADGRPVSLQRSAMRALPVIAAYFLLTSQAIGELPSPLHPWSMVLREGAFFTAMGLLLGGLVLIAMDPLRQGVGDQWAQTFIARTPIGQAFRQTANARRTEALVQARSRALGWALAAAAALAGMTSCQASRHFARVREADLVAPLQFFHSEREAFTIDGYRPGSAPWLFEGGQPADGITTAGLSLVYMIDGHAPGGLASRAVERAVERIESWEDRAAEIRGLLLRQGIRPGQPPPPPASDETAPVVAVGESGYMALRRDIQIVEAEAVVVERFLILGVYQQNRLVDRQKRTVSFPPDRLLIPNKPGAKDAPTTATLSAP